MQMRKLTSILAASSLLALAAGGVANAAPANTASWNGFYVGAVIGAQITGTNFALPGDTSDTLISNHDTNTGFIGGGVVGYNYQINNIVLGLEGDVIDANHSQRAVDCTVYGGCWSPAQDSFTTYNNLKEQVGGHVRVRVGIATGRTLLYAAGGYSIQGTRLDLTGDCYDPDNPAVPQLYHFSRSKTLSGFNLGAGVEQAITNHVILRAEYIYDDFGTQTYSGDGEEWNDRSLGVHSNNFRVGVSYKF